MIGSAAMWTSGPTSAEKELYQTVNIASGQRYIKSTIENTSDLYREHGQAMAYRNNRTASATIIQLITGNPNRNVIWKSGLRAFDQLALKPNNPFID